MKRMMSLLAACVTLVCVFCLTGCAQPSPTDVTKEFLSAVQSQDAKALASSYASDNLNVDDLAGSLAGESDEKSDDAKDDKASKDDDASKLTEKEQKTLDLVTEKLLGFEYEVIGEEVNGDSATVDVDITTYKTGDAVTKALNSYLSEAFMYAFAGNADEDKMADMFNDAICDELEDLDKKDYTANVKFSLTKTSDGWEIDELSEEQMDGLFGGVISAFSSWGDSFGSEEK